MSDTIPPHLLNEYHPNNALPIASITSTSLLLWKCSKGHEWEARYHHRLAGTGCPYCKNRKLLRGFNDLSTVNPNLAAEWHPTKNAPLTPSSVLYGSSKSVYWLCKNGHEWKTTIEGRNSRSTGCPYCAGVKLLSGYNDLQTKNPILSAEWHPTKNGALSPKMVTSNNSKKVWWLAKCGHEWESSIAKRNSMHRGCPYCVSQKLLEGVNDLATTHPHLAKQWHPTKNIVKPTQVIAGGKEKFWWVCDKGHNWESNINKRKQGSSCPVCLNQKIVQGVNDLATTNKDLAEEWDTQKNTIKPTQISGGTKLKASWIGKECGHSWDASVSERNGSHKTGCPKCPRSISVAESELLNYIKTLSPEERVESNTKKAVKGIELDIYLPDRNLAFEYNGLYWHSEEIQKDKNYHLNKWRACKEEGITLIQIWEDDYALKKEIVLEMVAQKIGISKRAKIYARNTYPTKISAEEAQVFLEANHIQGYVQARNCIALKSFQTNETVAVMLLKVEPKTNGKSLNLIRYATSRNVVGGFTKLLKYLLETNPQVTSIVTFSDNAISNGNLYSNNGFIMDSELPVDYSYIVKGKRIHKFNYRLKKFRNDPTLVWKEGLTEKQLANLNGLRRIWDAGKIKWIYRRNND
jgi:hypothetical protein